MFSLIYTLINGLGAFAWVSIAVKKHFFVVTSGNRSPAAAGLKVAGAIAE